MCVGHRYAFNEVRKLLIITSYDVVLLMILIFTISHDVCFAQNGKQELYIYI